MRESRRDGNASAHFLTPGELDARCRCADNNFFTLCGSSEELVVAAVWQSCWGLSLAFRPVARASPTRSRPAPGQGGGSSSGTAGASGTAGSSRNRTAAWRSPPRKLRLGSLVSTHPVPGAGERRKRTRRLLWTRSKKARPVAPSTRPASYVAPKSSGSFHVVALHEQQRLDADGLCCGDRERAFWHAPGFDRRSVGRHHAPGRWSSLLPDEWWQFVRCAVRGNRPLESADALHGHRSARPLEVDRRRLDLDGSRGRPRSKTRPAERAPDIWTRPSG